MNSIFTTVLLLLCSLCMTSHLYAQEKTYEFEDGSKIGVDIVSVDPDEGRNNSVYVGIFGPGGLQNFGIDYYRPKKYFVNALFGSGGFDVEGNIFFSSQKKPYKLEQSVKRSGGSNFAKKYMVAVPAVKRVSYGLHFGLNRSDYVKLNELYGKEEYPPFTTMGAFGGISLVKSKYASWLLGSRYEKRQGTSLIRFNLDFVYYFNQQYDPNAEMPLAIESVAREFGMRLYFDSRLGTWSRKGRVNWHFVFGLNLWAYRDAVPLMAGIGVGYNFNVRK